ncbi:IS3 family transposase [Lentzea sp. NEAU-D7]|uniref:IS3 family transposase n=1 Tax=Lentzea sp. NEAU-D7 TaxID=2994667 RepID=UPI00224ABC4B|nr:IS3 family transposase [Lentzea sp. NEAU-D7]MCX2950198.1 hypothetical protein [Lentzea sp. NEAU-D7]
MAAVPTGGQLSRMPYPSGFCSSKRRGGDEPIGWDRRSWRTRDEAENELFRYIDGFYNTERIQKDLGWLSPDEYETAWHTTRTEPTTIPASPTAVR